MVTTLPKQHRNAEITYRAHEQLCTAMMNSVLTASSTARQCHIHDHPGRLFFKLVLQELNTPFLDPSSFLTRLHLGHAARPGLELLVSPAALPETQHFCWMDNIKGRQHLSTLHAQDPDTNHCLAVHMACEAV